MSQVELTTLGKSCEFFNGKAHEKSIDESGKYIVVNSKFISSEGKSFKRTNEQMFPLYKGDIVMVMSDVPNGKALAKCFIIDKDDTYSLNQRICCIRSKEFDTKYLYYQLNRHEHFLAFNNGENQTNLRKDDILACPLIKPSMEEQKRMVQELDKVSIYIEKISDNILRNLKNSEELFLRELDELFKENKENWISNPLIEVCLEITDGSHFSPKTSSTGEYPYITVRDINNDFIDFENCKFINKDDYETLLKNGCKPNEGDLLFSKDGTVGKVSLVDFEKEFVVLSSLAIIRPKTDLIKPELLKYILKSPFFLQKAIGLKTGVAIRRIILKNLKGIYISYPKDFSEQESIIQKLKQLQIESNKLYNRYERKLAFCEELKAGVFKRAFENELIEAE
ncbi:restriction endonuclease subunit S [Lunatimonas salinarum]|uniref:restriction endonuclease subunit S n=1 Tax=Lunatimonas salinarum TaxID=1774590 RepID=UPI001ADFE006|nr:restriction endonuclease subunit S [Lunatimonas salinarum]